MNSSRKPKMAANCLSSHDAINNNEWLPCVVLLSILSISGAIINGFVLFVFLRMKTVFNNANKFLVILMTGQIMLAVAVGPFHIAQIVTTTNTAQCYLDTFKEYVESFTLISAVSNGVVSYDRYLHVSLAHNYKQRMSGLFLYTLLLFPWVTMAVYVVALTVSRVLSYAVLIVIVISLGFSLLFNYARLIKRLNVQQNNIAVGMQTRAYRKRRNDRAALLCISIIMVEFACSSAGFFTLICSSGASTIEGRWQFWEDRNAIVREVSFILFMFSACLNPFLYLYNHREFKQYVALFFKRAKVGQALDDFVEERAGRVRMQQNGNISLPGSANHHGTIRSFTEDGEVKIFSAANAIGHK